MFNFNINNIISSSFPLLLIFLSFHFIFPTTTHISRNNNEQHWVTLGNGCEEGFSCLCHSPLIKRRNKRTDERPRNKYWTENFFPIFSFLFVFPFYIFINFSPPTITIILFCIKSTEINWFWYMYTLLLSIIMFSL